MTKTVKISNTFMSININLDVEDSESWESGIISLSDIIYLELITHEVNDYGNNSILIIKYDNKIIGSHRLFLKPEDRTKLIDVIQYRGTGRLNPFLEIESDSGDEIRLIRIDKISMMKFLHIQKTHEIESDIDKSIRIKRCNVEVIFKNCEKEEFVITKSMVKSISEYIMA